MNDLSYIYMLETSHYIQTMGDMCILESYNDYYYESTKMSLWDRIKAMIQKVKDFFKRIFTKKKG